MDQIIFSIRMDRKLKKDFDELCSQFGMTASTAFNIFVKKVVKEKEIPFKISLKDESWQGSKGYKAFLSMREKANSNNKEYTSDEINKEISESRRDRKRNNDFTKK